MRNQLISCLLVFLCLTTFHQSIAQDDRRPVDHAVEQNRPAFEKLQATGLFSLLPDQAAQAQRVQNAVTNATFYKIDDANRGQLLRQQPEAFKLQLKRPGGETMELWLYRAEIFTEDALIHSSSARGVQLNYERGAYYWGNIGGDNGTLAAIAINKNEIMGFVQDGAERYTLGKLENSDATIFYRNADLLAAPGFGCDTDDDIHRIGNTRVEETENDPSTALGPDNCVNLYIEVDNSIVTGKGGVTPAANYVVGAFSQVFLLYANESVNFSISELFLWDTADPYTGPSTGDYLSQFRSNVGSSFNGDLAHLVGYQGSGGIAYVDVLCNKNFAFGYSDINASYNNVPTYSWTVEVLTHEIGHNLASPHTHACRWGPNNDQPIDCCGYNAGYSESSCGTGYDCSIPNPVSGTIMSYCHLVGGVGIDFNLGFGTEPGDLIRDRVYNRSCLSPCQDCSDNGGDNDGDGVCANEDCNDNDPSQYAGAPCDNGDDCTSNDVLDANCNCVGTPSTSDANPMLTLHFDDYPEETNWDIRDGSNAVVASGGTYGSQPDGSTLVVPITLSNGSYTFTIYDSYGDGICCDFGNGSYSLESNGATIASGGEFAASESTGFCIVDADPCVDQGGDTDGDGTCDNADGCPTDPNKTEPGDCGCGVADLDSDNDGTADCADACPTDPGKIAPGDCGCGIADNDSDGDGTADCSDGCPNDPNKTEAGDCGCGVADADSDNDGIADCNDGCPNDPNKTDPGTCGCDVADVDIDGDGTADCFDDCPNDPNKIAAGDCGCGVADLDSDDDGTADCADACPTDPNKTDPGTCGCDVTDVDSDGDGTLDCSDGCPDDPDKIAPGDCGCGVADTDSDNDGTADCNDACPNDPDKTDTGDCGCGVADADSDNDGIADCNDGCPTDPNKTEPGDCGCGVADADSDNDGIADCNDACPDDPDKTAPGDCGCGIADADSDGDGTADCSDSCPNDPNKTEAGDCGCGVADADSDNDGIADCNDGCPNDPNKTDPGTCGCDVADVDSDGDSIADCNDVCPDRDDTIDEDSNGIPDACENDICVEVINAFNPNPLTATRRVRGKTRLILSGNSDVSFTIDNINAVTTGKRNFRFIEEVRVFVDNGNERYLYGTYRGDQVGEANVSIAGPVERIVIKLREVYDGSTRSLMSVDISDVTSCANDTPPSRNTAPDPVIEELSGVDIFPNPSDGLILMRFAEEHGTAIVKVYNMLGKHIATETMEAAGVQSIDIRDHGLKNQFAIIQIHVEGQQPYVQRIMIYTR